MTKAAFISSPLDEPVISENLNGHATSSLTPEKVKVDIESQETLREEQATGPVRTEEKPGNLWTSHNITFVILWPVIQGWLESLTVRLLY